MGRCAIQSLESKMLSAYREHLNAYIYNIGLPHMHTVYIFMRPPRLTELRCVWSRDDGPDAISIVRLTYSPAVGHMSLMLESRSKQIKRAPFPRHLIDDNHRQYHKKKKNNVNHLFLFVDSLFFFLNQHNIQFLMN